MSDHHFNPKIADSYGVNAAIFLNNLAYWTEQNAANKKNYHDGRCWSYNSQEAFALLFTYWTRQNIRTIIKTCIDNGLVLTGSYNKLSYDKTKWYALSDKGLLLFDRLQPILSANGWNQPIDWLPVTVPLVGINQPIPYKKLINKPDKKTKEKEEEVCSDMENTTQYVCKHGTDAEKSKDLISFFPDTDFIKTHLKHVIAKRNIFVEDDVFNQIMFYVGDELKEKQVKLKVNIALKKVREGTWNIPNEYKGITSKSIREKEERMQRAKEELYKQDAEAFQEIESIVFASGGLKVCTSLREKLWGDVDALKQATLEAN